MRTFRVRGSLPQLSIVSTPPGPGAVQGGSCRSEMRQPHFCISVGMEVSWPHPAVHQQILDMSRIDSKQKIAEVGGVLHLRVFNGV